MDADQLADSEKAGPRGQSIGGEGSAAVGSSQGDEHVVVRVGRLRVQVPD